MSQRSNLPSSGSKATYLTSSKIGQLSLQTIDAETVKLLLSDPFTYANKISVSKLVNILKSLSHEYYNTQTSPISDDIYDILKNVLATRDPNNKFLKEIGAPISKDKVKLPCFMASLDKIKPDTSALDSWKTKYTGPYVLTDKLDGVSALLVISSNNNNKKLYTRGDGEYGQDISHLIEHINIFKNVKNIQNIQNIQNIIIRGELIISKENFKNMETTMKNARNAVAGLVNSKEFSIKIAKATDFVAYSIVVPRYTQIEELKKLEQLGFRVVTNIVKTDINNNMLSEYLVDRRQNAIYEVDGIVVTDSGKVYNIPDENKNPQYAFAFKTVMTDQVAEVIVLDVEWKPSMYGFLKPRVKIEPVKLVGVDINYATAFNAKFVFTNNLGPGSKIKLVRSGDVIPHIMEVLTPSATGGPKMPSVPYKWNSTKVDVIVEDIEGVCKNSISIKKITHFFKTIGVKYLSEGIVKKFVDNGYNTIVKILQADHKNLYKIDGLGTTIVNKIYNNINKSFKTLTLQTLMAASLVFGKGFGVRKLKIIVTAYPNIMNEKWDDKILFNNVNSLNGFDIITSTLFVNSFDTFKTFYADLAKVVDLSYLNNIAINAKVDKADKANTANTDDKSNKLNGLKIVFTGIRDPGLHDFVENNGGIVNTTVSKNTDIVIYPTPESTNDTKYKNNSKYKKAIQLNIKTMHIMEFKKEYNYL
jgi:DNA ligase (NAD+)